MLYNFILSQEAEEAVHNATEWYEQQRNGLGKEFLIAVDNAFLSIQSNPLLYGFRKKNIRGYSIRRFPYVIFFSVKRGTVEVISFLHTSQKPRI